MGTHPGKQKSSFPSARIFRTRALIPHTRYIIFLWICCCRIFISCVSLVTSHDADALKRHNMGLCFDNNTPFNLRVVCLWFSFLVLSLGSLPSKKYVTWLNTCRHMWIDFAPRVYLWVATFDSLSKHNNIIHFFEKQLKTFLLKKAFNLWAKRFWIFLYKLIIIIIIIIYYYYYYY